MPPAHLFQQLVQHRALAAPPVQRRQPPGSGRVRRALACQVTRSALLGTRIDPYLPRPGVGCGSAAAISNSRRVGAGSDPSLRANTGSLLVHRFPVPAELPGALRDRVTFSWLAPRITVCIPFSMPVGLPYTWAASRPAC